MSFAALKKNAKSDLSKLAEQAQKLEKNNTFDDDNDKYWKLSVDKAQNGSAIIRFLPQPDGEDMPFVRYWDHGFQGPTGQWYIEKSLTTLGKDDPVSEFNSKLWNAGDDNSPERAQARKQKRRLHYVSNIYVVKDPANPENNGKVFLYEYGKKIFDKINEAMHPVEDPLDESPSDPINPFDLWNGANFRLKARKVDGYRNYGESSFDTVSALSDDDEELEKIWKSEYSLAELISPDKFKSYDELQARLNKVLDITVITRQDAEMAEPKMKEVKSSVEDDVPFETDDEDSLEMFKKIIDDD